MASAGMAESQEQETAMSSFTSGERETSLF